MPTDKILAEAEEAINIYIGQVSEIFRDHILDDNKVVRDIFITRTKDLLAKALTQQRQELEAEREKWLEEIMPEKSFARLGSENQEIYVAYSNGFNAGRNQIKQNAKKLK